MFRNVPKCPAVAERLSVMYWPGRELAVLVSSVRDIGETNPNEANESELKTLAVSGKRGLRGKWRDHGLRNEPIEVSVTSGAGFGRRAPREEPAGLGPAGSEASFF